MAAYYFLIAQLPSLSYNAEPPMASKAFAEMCRTKLAPAHAKALEACYLDTLDESVSATPFVNAWRNWERTLRLQLARFRKDKLQREGTAIEPPEFPADAVAAAKAAAGIESPLEAELFLDEARWRAIEGLQGLATFHENVIFAYLLKLQLLERRALFKPDEGYGEYQTLYGEVLKSAKEAVAP